MTIVLRNFVQIPPTLQAIQRQDYTDQEIIDWIEELAPQWAPMSIVDVDGTDQLFAQDGLWSVGELNPEDWLVPDPLTGQISIYPHARFTAAWAEAL
jgi:hypothetical protein